MSFESVSMQFLFWSGIGSIVLLFISMIILQKNKRFEKIELEPGINAVLFGILLMIVSAFIYVLDFAFKAYPEKAAENIASIEQYIPMAIQSVDIGLLPLLAICLLIGVVYFRDNA